MKERPAATIAQRIRFLESVRECHGEASELLERLASVEAPGMEPKKKSGGSGVEARRVAESRLASYGLCTG